MANELHDIKHETFSLTPLRIIIIFRIRFWFISETQTFHGNYDGNDHGAGNEANEWA